MASRVENAEYASMLRRQIRAAGKRFGSNPDDLRLLNQLHAEVNEALHAAVARARADYGLPWELIGRNLGCTRQAAQQRFGKSASAAIRDKFAHTCSSDCEAPCVLTGHIVCQYPGQASL